MDLLASSSAHFREKRSGGLSFIDPDDVCIFDRDCDGISYCRSFRCELTWWFILILVIIALSIIASIFCCIFYCLGYCRR